MQDQTLEGCNERYFWVIKELSVANTYLKVAWAVIVIWIPIIIWYTRNIDTKLENIQSSLYQHEKNINTIWMKK